MGYGRRHRRKHKVRGRLVFEYRDFGFFGKLGRSVSEHIAWHKDAGEFLLQFFRSVLYTVLSNIWLLLSSQHSDSGVVVR
jgi:hypothetical protein